MVALILKVLFKVCLHPSFSCVPLGLNEVLMPAPIFF